jgi:Spy/CpxP family protein refolding chaperone
MKRGWIVFTGGLALAVGGTALAQMGPGMMGPGGMMGGGMMVAGATNDRPWITVMLDHREELGLSLEQVGRLFTLRDGFAKEARKKSEVLEQIERGLDQLLGPGPVDLQAVEAKVKEAEAMRTDLRLARIKVIEEGKGVLTPEQRAKFVELVKQSPRSSGGATQGGTAPTTRGMEEMRRFMQSDQAPETMAAMMDMARRMGDGDTMLGMVRMMEMMGSMAGMMGPEGKP